MKYQLITKPAFPFFGYKSIVRQVRLSPDATRKAPMPVLAPKDIRLLSECHTDRALSETN